MYPQRKYSKNLDIIQTDVLLITHTCLTNWDRPTAYLNALNHYTITANDYSVLTLKAPNISFVGWRSSGVCWSFHELNCRFTSAFKIHTKTKVFWLHVRFPQCICGCRQWTWCTVEQTVGNALCPSPWGFLSDWPCHRPSIMARSSSPLLQLLGDWSRDSVNSPMILVSSSWSWKTMLPTSTEMVNTGIYNSLL